MTRSEDIAAIRDPQAPPAAYTRLLAPVPPPPALRENAVADCVIVGMGITGNSAAIHLADRGASVVQLEAGDVGAGGSGRAFGLVVPYGKHGEARIAKDFGPEQAERYMTTVAEGPALFKALVGRFAIPDAIHGEGWFLGPYTSAATAGLEARANFWRARGAPVEFLTGQAVRDRIGSDRYAAGLFDARALAVNPLAYTVGLARAAASLGVRQFAQSPAIAIKRAGSRWRVATPHGSIDADRVLICTDSYTGALWPGLAASAVRIRGHQAVTKPLPPETLAHILPGAAIVTDTRHTWSGLKKLPDGRLHLSAGGPALGAHARADLAGVTRRVRELYPDLRVEWESDWSGYVALTPDQYPAIKHLADGVWAGHGYSGRGLAAATLMGRELARIAVQATPDGTFVPIVRNRALPFAPIARCVAAGLIAFYAMADRLAAPRG